MAKTAKFSEALQEQIARETEHDTLLNVANKHGIRKGTVSYYRRKFNITATCGKMGAPKKPQKPEVMTGLHPAVAALCLI